MLAIGVLLTTMYGTRCIAGVVGKIGFSQTQILLFSIGVTLIVLSMKV